MTVPLRTTFAKVVVAVMLLQLAWATCIPLYRGIDELDHLYRAASIAAGHLTTDSQSASAPPATRVPRDIANSAAPMCHRLYDELRPETCVVSRKYADGTVGLVSRSSSYNPAYYSLVAPAIWGLDGTVSAWGMRALSAFLCAVLIAFAWTITMSTSTTFWPTVALLAVTTPAVLYASIIVAPNGLHFAAGLLLWAGLLTASRRTTPSRLDPLAIAVGGAVLCVTHTTGLAWLGLIAIATAVCCDLKAVREAAIKHRRTWVGALAIVSGAAIWAVLWVAVNRTNIPDGSSAGELYLAEVKSIPLVAHAVLWIFQTVGAIPNRFGMLWMPIYGLWILPLCALLILGWRRASRRLRFAITFTMTVSIAIPFVATWLTYDALGVQWQGRYGLPLLFGIVLLCAEALERKPPALPRIYLTLGITVLAVAQFLAIICVGYREAAGPYDDGRPWDLLMWGVVPVLVAAAYAGFWALVRPLGRTS